MAYTNSSMVEYTKLSPNHSGQRMHIIDRITPHCVVGQVTAEGLGNWFARTSTEASSNYGIDRNGRVGLYVEKKNRSCCSSSSANDQRAITIECASDNAEPYAFRDVVYARLVQLCVDICKRNGKTKLLWLESKDKTLNYTPKPNEMILTVHRWFANKSCPGNWMFQRMGDLANKVTTHLGETPETPTQNTPIWYRVRRNWADIKSQKGAFKSLDNAKACADENAGFFVFDETGKEIYPGTGVFKPYLVRVSSSDLNIRKGPGTNYERTQYIPVGTYTIVEEKAGQGASKWGRLKSGAGWISLDFASKL